MLKPIDYKQNDTKWGSNAYAVDGENSTIRSAGCGPTAMADVMAAIVTPYIDPLSCASWARQHGYKAYKSGTSYNYPVAQGAAYGVNVCRINTANVYGNIKAEAHVQALQSLLNGDWIIACMGKGLWTNSGHYVVAYGFSNGMVYINDPASTAASRTCNSWTLFSSQVKYYWVVSVPNNIKLNGIVKIGNYTMNDFVRECQMCLKARIDGKAGNQTLSKTVTINPIKKINNKHNVVLPLQKFMKQKGYYTGALDRSAGPLFQSAINCYQQQILRYSKLDGEITAKGRMWKSILNMI